MSTLLFRSANVMAVAAATLASNLASAQMISKPQFNPLNSYEIGTNSGHVIETNPYQSIGAEVYQSAATDGDSQAYQFIKLDDGYHLISPVSHDGLCFEAGNAKISLENCDLGDVSQHFKFHPVFGANHIVQIRGNGRFIKSAQNDGVLLEHSDNSGGSDLIFTISRTKTPRKYSLETFEGGQFIGALPNGRFSLAPWAQAWEQFITGPSSSDYVSISTHFSTAVVPADNFYHDYAGFGIQRFMTRSHVDGTITLTKYEDFMSIGAKDGELKYYNEPFAYMYGNYPSDHEGSMFPDYNKWKVKFHPINESPQKYFKSGLKSNHWGGWLAALPDGGVTGASIHEQEWETFQIVKLGLNKVAIKTHHGTYLAALPDGGVNNKPTVVDAWETWEMIQAGDDQIFLKGHFGGYLMVHPDGSVRSDAKEPLEWERFNLTNPDII